MFKARNIGITRWGVGISLFMFASAGIGGGWSRADDSGSSLRIGVKALSDGSELVVLGTANSHLDAQVSQQLDQMGLQIQGGHTSQDFEPQYVILKNAEGIQQVYSLALPHGGELKDSAKILDSATVKKDAIKGNIPRGLALVTQNFVANKMKALIQALAPVFKHKEQARADQAKQLANLFADTLNTHDDVGKNILGTRQANPELLSVFSPDELNQAYDDMNRRYSTYVAGGFLSRNSQRATASRERLADQNDGQQIPLVAYANQEGYVRFPMKRFSMLAFDCASLQKTQRDDHGMDIGDIKNQFFAERCAKWPGSGGQYIPFAIYSTDQSKVSAQIIDFSDPHKLKDKRFLKMAEQLATTALQGVGGSGYAVKFVDDLYRDRQIRHGSTLDLADTGSAYHELQMEAKEGSIHLNGDITDPNDAAKLDTTLFMSDLARQKGMPQSQIEEIGAGFASTDMSLWDKSFQTTLEYIGADQSGVAVLSPGSGAQKEARDQNRAQGNLTQLTSRLQDPAVLSALDQQMQARNLAAQIPVSPPKPPSKKELKAEALFQKNLAAAQAAGKCAPAATVVEFQVDGLKPENLALAAKNGLVPTLKDRVIDHGVQFNSFVTNTVSTSSWTTIRSGKPEDDTVITGSSCFASRDPKAHDDNCLDYRGDYKLKTGYTEETVGGSRIYKAIKQTGNDVFPDSIDTSQRLTDISPVHDGANINPKAVAKSGADFGKDYLYGNDASSGANLLDGGNTQAFVDAIHAHPCQYREVQIWLGSVDEDSHTSPRSLDRTYQRIDADAKKLLDAMATDPVLKNARIVIDSDHGLSGGVERPDATRGVLPDQTIFMKDTSRNYTHCFAGNCKGWEDFDFVVGSLNPDEPKRGGVVSVLNRTILKPFNFSYKGEKGHKNEGREGYKDHRTMLAESYGNQMEAFYFLCDGVKPGESCAHQDPSKRSSYYDLTHYKNDKGQTLDIASRLLGDQVQNTVVDDNPAVKKALYDKTQNRPIAFLAMPLQGEAARASAAKMAGVSTQGLRDPVLLRAYEDKASLILTRDTPTGPEYRYIVLSGFSQSKDGTISGTPVMGAENDPLGYKVDVSGWRDKHGWLDLLQNTEYPTAVFALSRNLTLDPARAKDPQYQARVPDMLAYSNEGFDLNPYQNNLGNHGALRHEIAHNTLYISGCGTAAQSTSPVLGEQIGQTIKKWLGDSSTGNDDLNSQFNAACTAAENQGSTNHGAKPIADPGTGGTATGPVPADASKAK